MSLIYAEGFEHFHPSAILQPWFTPKISVREVAFGLSACFPYAGSADTEKHIVRSGVTSSGIDIGRKGGKAYGYLPTAGARNKLSVAFTFKKSRSVFIGFALRLAGIPANSQPGWDCEIAVRFGRSLKRKMVQGNYEIPLADTFATGTYRNRNGYGDVEWGFNGRPSAHGQISHNRNIANGDWHYFEFGTTVYGNVPNAPDGWAECRVASVGDKRTNIFTSSALEDESYINFVEIQILSTKTNVTSPWTWIDDIYACNDEGSSNNHFLGGIFVRPMRPSHSGAFFESSSVGALSRHEAVGPHFVGDETTLPNPLPTHEDDPDFVEWGRADLQHLLMPWPGSRQSFRCTDAGFAGSSPRIHGVTLDVIAEIAAPILGRSVLVPIKTIDGNAHTYFPPSSDMVAHSPSLNHLIMENPFASGTVNPYDPLWSAAAVDSSEYGFRVDPVLDQTPFEPLWNQSLLRHPVYHDQTLDEVFGMEDWASRHWEEVVDEPVSLDIDSRWDWACRAFDIMAVFDESFSPSKILKLSGWTNLRSDDSIVSPEEYVRDFLGLEDANRFDSVARVEEELGTIVFAYHEHVEELRVWLDPYDHVERAWGVNAFDDLGFEVSDIFDGHFDVEEEFDATVQARSNHELLEETLYAHSWTQHGLVLPTLEDDLDLYADHFDGNWVEQFEDSFGAASSILTRHWRFEIFFMVCIKWWEVGVVEQPLDYLLGERDPCAVKNDNIFEAYKLFFGIDGYYEEAYAELRTQWLNLGGDPELDLANVRWSAFDTFVFDGMGNVVDMLDTEGNSIIEVM